MIFHEACVQPSAGFKSEGFIATMALTYADKRDADREHNTAGCAWVIAKTEKSSPNTKSKQVDQATERKGKGI